MKYFILALYIVLITAFLALSIMQYINRREKAEYSAIINGITKAIAIVSFALIYAAYSD